MLRFTGSPAAELVFSAYYSADIFWVNRARESIAMKYRVLFSIYL